MLAGKIVLERELAGKGGHGLLERKKCWQKETVAPSHRAQGTPMKTLLIVVCNAYIITCFCMKGICRHLVL